MPSTPPDLGLDAHLLTASSKAGVLLEALPYLRAFREKIFVIKYGGSALGDPALRRRILQDIVFLSLVGIRPVLVHGGGPDISQRMARQGQAARFVEGLRVTDEATLRIVATSLQQLNHRLVRELRALGGRPVGFAARGPALLQTRPMTIRGHDLGYVGTIVAAHPQPVLHALRQGQIPVVWPLGRGHDHHLYNVNADQAAADLAGALTAEKLVLVTDVRGILRAGTLVPSVTARQVETLVGRGVITKGMIPKARACVHALGRGVRKTHMIDIKIPHGLLLELFTDRGIGTEITRTR